MATVTDNALWGRTADKERSEVDRIYDLLRDWVIAAKLQPGAFLSESELAERCGASRTPVREALSRLVQDGWVSSIHRKGFQVRPIDLRDISEIFTYRRLFECYAGERAAVTATAAQITELEEIIGLERRPGISRLEDSQLNERFHMALVHRTENERMIGQMRLVMAYMRRLYALVSVVDLVDHNEILEAIKARNGVRAGFLLGEHVDFALQSMIKSFFQ
jgi:DNA-binding GntR family transcriptional regulator